MNNIIKEELKLYSNYLKIKGYSNIYIYYLKRYLLYIYNKYKSIDINILISNNINREYNTIILKNNSIMNEYILELINSHKYKPETINLCIKAINSYIDFKEVNLKKVNLLKVDKTIPDSFDMHYLRYNIFPMVEELFPEAEKIKLLFLFWFYTGLRLGELLSLTRKDIDLKTRRAKIYGKKTKTERYVIIPKKLIKELNLYFSQEQEKINAFNITKGNIYYIFRQLKPFFKDIRLRPHLFRHSMATNLVKSKMSIIDVQKLLGHSNIQTTIRYINREIDETQEDFDEKIK